MLRISSTLLKEMRPRITLMINIVGKKIDNWFLIDWRTGTKEELLSADNSDKVCPLMSRNSMFLGRTGQYQFAE